MGRQFFFSVRSVYVVVLTGRENNERADAEYWLRLIKAFGTDGQGKGPPRDRGAEQVGVRPYPYHLLRRRQSLLATFATNCVQPLAPCMPMW